NQSHAWENLLRHAGVIESPMLLDLWVRIEKKYREPYTNSCLAGLRANRTVTGCCGRIDACTHIDPAAPLRQDGATACLFRRSIRPTAS
ncbi:hypothetical protein, partial [Burkholderia sp.]|uniref:hypothetical protein n=1 Tax=Burkholderia sp. TaxID=36773 RepID=UPI00258E51A5